MVSLVKKPFRAHTIGFCAAAAVCFVLFVHPDIIETANHGYLFLDYLFSGRIMNFYNEIAVHKNDLYYINFAHYNIFVYLIFAVVQLPYFAVNQLFGLAPSEPVIYFTGKLVCAAFFAGCVYMVLRIARQLGMSEEKSNWAALFFALWPPAFFAPLIMGQYDCIGLFFTLAGLLYWMRGRLNTSALWFGAGAACKFFPLFLLVPLMLLVEKRLLPLLKYGLISLWLVLPTTLLFAGRTNDMALFNEMMTDRLFASVIPGTSLPLFPILFLLVCLAAYLYRPAKERQNAIGLWVCLLVYGLLFLLVQWHTQWVLLLAPFVVLTTFLEKRRGYWRIIDVALAAGFFIICAFKVPGQLEANLLDFGLVGILSGLRTTNMDVAGYNMVSTYYNLVSPHVFGIASALFGGAVAANILFKAPWRGQSLAAHLGRGGPDAAQRHTGRQLWAVFGAGLAVFLLPALFTWVKCFGFL